MGNKYDYENVNGYPYKVTYKPNDYTDEVTFIGVCENFYPSGSCVFYNPKNGILVVDYRKILLMERCKDDFYKRYISRDIEGGNKNE